MKLNGSAYCPDCEEVFPYNRYGCPSCTNRSTVPLSRILFAKEVKNGEINHVDNVSDGGDGGGLPSKPTCDPRGHLDPTLLCDAENGKDGVSEEARFFHQIVRVPDDVIPGATYCIDEDGKLIRSKIDLVEGIQRSDADTVSDL